MRQKLIFMALACLFTGSARADTFTDTPSKMEFLLTGMADFDQRRDWGTVTIGSASYPVLGLSNHGNEYCVPTSCTDLCGFLANRGYPGLCAGPTIESLDYRSGVGGWAEYNAISFTIDVMAIGMGTNPMTGTGSGGAHKGLQSFLDAGYPGDFVVNSFNRDSTGFPRAFQALGAGLTGRVIAMCGGWYHTTEYNGSTVYYRAGGHCCALPEVYWDTTLLGPNFYLCNPESSDSTMQQSAFSYDLHATTPLLETFTQVNSSNIPIPGTQQTLACDEIAHTGTAWILDGLNEIHALDGFTNGGPTLHYLNPMSLTNGSAFPNGYASLTSADGSAIKDPTQDPISGKFLYLTANGGKVVYIADPIAKTTIARQTTVTPRQVLYSAEFLPYMLYGTGTIGLFNPNTGTVTQIANLGTVDRIVFSPSNNLVVAISWGDRTATFLNHFGVVQGFVHLPAVQSPTTATVRVGGNGHLYISQASSSTLTEISPAGTVYHTISDLAHAATFALDDWNRVYLSVNGSIVVTDMNGTLLPSKFSGLPAGTGLVMSHSITNFDPNIHQTPEWYDVPNG